MLSLLVKYVPCVRPSPGAVREVRPSQVRGEPVQARDATDSCGPVKHLHVSPDNGKNSRTPQKPQPLLRRHVRIRPSLKNGRGGRTRTADLLNPIQARCQTALRPVRRASPRLALILSPLRPNVNRCEAAAAMQTVCRFLCGRPKAVLYKWSAAAGRRFQRPRSGQQKYPSPRSARFQSGIVQPHSQSPTEHPRRLQSAQARAALRQKAPRPPKSQAAPGQTPRQRGDSGQPSKAPAADAKTRETRGSPAQSASQSARAYQQASAPAKCPALWSRPSGGRPAP